MPEAASLRLAAFSEAPSFSRHSITPAVSHAALQRSLQSRVTACISMSRSLDCCKETPLPFRHHDALGGDEVHEQLITCAVTLRSQSLLELCTEALRPAKKTCLWLSKEAHRVQGIGAAQHALVGQVLVALAIAVARRVKGGAA